MGRKRNYNEYTLVARKNVKKIVEETVKYQSKLKNFSDEKLKYMKTYFKNQLEAGVKIEKLYPLILATACEAIRRVKGYLPYDVQIEAAAAMKDNVVAEMMTGEGKSLVQILEAYLKNIEGNNVHIFTANDYLAKRDFDDSKAVFESLGLSCGLVQGKNSMEPSEKREAYDNDIVYGTASTMGFDYLRDNMVFDVNDRVMSRPLGYAIVDEVDSILIDDGTTPHIISGKSSNEKLNKTNPEEINIYLSAMSLVNKLKCAICETLPDGEIEFSNYFFVYESKHKSVLISPVVETLLAKRCFKKEIETLNGQELQKLSNLLDVIRTCVIAKYGYIEGKEYMLTSSDDNKKEVTLIDQTTDRLVPGRRVNGGIHQAIEAKEKLRAMEQKLPYDVEIKPSTVTKATCTYPDYFSLYKNGFSGMTGTSNAKEFKKIYGIETYEVPTRKEVIRIDEKEEVYVRKKQKYEAILREVIRAHKTGQPILIGTTSIKESKELSKLFNKYGITHNLLNAANSKQENDIIKKAGLLGAVTVATNMAGRGTDIKLGGGDDLPKEVRDELKAKVIALGGLYVIGVSRKRSKRIDDQLRGRAGRQGDEGKTKFFSAIEDYVSNQKALSKYEKLADSKTGKIKYLGNSTIDKIQNAQELDDMARRERNKFFGNVLSEQKKQIYEYRDKMLKSPVDHLIEQYDNYINKLSFEEDHFINTAIGNITRGHPENANVKDIIKKTWNKNNENILRTKVLRTIDKYWEYQLQDLTEIKEKAYRDQYADKDLKVEFPLQAWKSFSLFSRDMVMEIYTFATHPNLEYNDIDEFIVVDEKNKAYEDAQYEEQNRGIVI